MVRDLLRLCGLCLLILIASALFVPSVDGHARPGHASTCRLRFCEGCSPALWKPDGRLLTGAREVAMEIRKHGDWRGR